jgi:hypothetical protein
VSREQVCFGGKRDRTSKHFKNHFALANLAALFERFFALNAYDLQPWEMETPHECQECGSWNEQRAERKGFEEF